MLGDTLLLLTAMRVANALDNATDRVREAAWVWRTTASYFARTLWLSARDALGGL